MWNKFDLMLCSYFFFFFLMLLGMYIIIFVMYFFSVHKGIENAKDECGELILVGYQVPTKPLSHSSPQLDKDEKI